MVSSIAGHRQSRRATSQPAAVLAAFFAAGIAAGSYLVLPPAIVLSAIVFALLLFPWAASSSRGWPAVAAAFFLAGALIAELEDRSSPPGSVRWLFENGLVASGEPVVIEGTMPGGAEILPDSRIIDIEVDRIRLRGSVRRSSGAVRTFLAVRGEEARSELDALRLRAGSRISVAAIIEREEKYVNPGGSRLLELLERDGIDARATVKSPLLVANLGDGRRSLRGFAVSVRNSLTERILSQIGQPAVGIALASMLGNRHFLTKDAADTYREAGTFHILVVSGLHVTLLGATILSLLTGAGTGRISRVLITLVAVWTFASVSGLGLPVIRASVMFSFVAAGLSLRRGISGLNSLGAATLVILTADPYAVFDPSFQLTAISVLAITGFGIPLIGRYKEIGSWYPTVSKPLPPRAHPLVNSFAQCLYWSESAWGQARKQAVWDCEIPKSSLARRLSGSILQKLLQIAFAGIVLTLSVQAFLLPLQVLYFHRIAPAGIILNLAAGAFLGVFALLTAATSLLSLVSTVFGSTLAALVDSVADLWLTLQVSVTSFGGQTRVPVYSGAFKFIYLVYLVPAVHFIVILNRWNPFASGPRSSSRSKRISAALIGGLGLLILVHPFSEPSADGMLSVTFLDVGQGDSIFVRFPEGQTMLIDGGGRRRFAEELHEGADNFFEPDARGIGEAVVSEFLWEKGYSSVDTLVLTHPDADHIRGLTDVMRNFSVSYLIFAEQAIRSEDQKDLFQTAFSMGVLFEEAKSGGTFRHGDVLVEFPAGGEISGVCPDKLNDRSLVVRITYGSRRFLLTGDIEGCAEEALLKAADSIRADVVKVPHHGSRTSSTPEFVEATGADYAVVSAGRRSQFGHPHREVVETWKASGAKVLTTADCGAITIRTDGSWLETECYIESVGRTEKRPGSVPTLPSVP